MAVCQFDIELQHRHTIQASKTHQQRCSQSAQVFGWLPIIAHPIHLLLLYCFYFA
jgi:hypothetical protein